MIVEWHPCRHITYRSDDEDQSGWNYLQATCPDCAGIFGVNVQDGHIEESGVEAAPPPR
jgi:hypothetical protein